MRRRRDRNLNFGNETITIQKLFDEHEKRLRRKNRADSTIRTDKQRFQKNVKDFYNTLDLRDLTIEDHQALFDEMEAVKDSPQLRSKVRTLLHTMFEHAVEKQLFDGAFQFNPIRAIERPEYQKPSIQFLNPKEIRVFLDKNQDDPYYPLYVTLFYTGLRIGEALGLHWEQIDLDQNILMIDRQWNDLELKITRLKGKQVRHLGIIEEVREVLATEGEGLVFRKLTGSKRLGGPLRPNFFRREILPQACARAKVKEISPHGFRHSFAALWLFQGGTMEDLRALLGHRNQQITEDYYGHLDFSHIRNRMGIISKVGNVIRANFERRQG